VRATAGERARDRRGASAFTARARASSLRHSA
jgi:hypothetical protein